MKKIIALSFAFLAPFTLVHAVAGVAVTNVSDVSSFAVLLGSYFDLAVQLMVAAAVAWVIWSAFQFVLSAGDEESRGKARDGIIYGIIGIAVMLSVWGLVRIFLTSTGITANPAHIAVPTVN